ncbi:MAG: glycosyltransferase [Candidatus Methylacidiphilales bacterium]
MPRIAMVSTHGYVAANPPLGAADTGGQVVYVLELSKKLAQLGYEVDIWTRQFESQPPVDVISDQVRVLRVPCGGSDFIPKEYLYKKLHEWGENALRFIREHNLHYTFINSHYWDAGLAGQHLAEVLRIPHIHTPHSLGLWKKRQMETDYQHDPASFEETFNFTKRIHYENQLYRESQLVIATTPVQTDMLRADYELPTSKILMIPPGYDDNRFFPTGAATREAIRQRLGFKGKVILALGRLASNKGYDLLIQAFREVAIREPDAHLHLAVGGEKMDSGEKQILEECHAIAAQLDLQDRIHFTGYVSDEDLPDTYRAADVFVLSSRYEPFGMTAIEAMACGTPTVATTHGGLFRVLRFGVDGLFADTFDSADLGITMLKPLRHQKLWDRLSRNGAQTARSLFTWTGIAQQLICAFEQRQKPAFQPDEWEASDQWFGHDEKV